MPDQSICHLVPSETPQEHKCEAKNEEMVVLMCDAKNEENGCCFILSAGLFWPRTFRNRGLHKQSRLSRMQSSHARSPAPRPTAPAAEEGTARCRTTNGHHQSPTAAPAVRWMEMETSQWECNTKARHYHDIKAEAARSQASVGTACDATPRRGPPITGLPGPGEW